MKIRNADFAGAWYPARASECEDAILSFIKEARPCPGSKANIGGIVPHAGWIYSGRLACNVIKCLRESGDAETCLIFGRHLHKTSSNFIMKEGAWSTPFGTLVIDSEVAGQLCSEFPFRIESPEYYEQDNTVELQLPFLKYFFGDIKIVPMGLPPNLESLAIARRVAQVCENFGRKTIVLGSTDLTHYGYNYGFMPAGSGAEAVQWVKDINDRRVIDLMLNMETEDVIKEALENHNACCAGAVASAIEACRVLGAQKAYELDYYTSYDIRPDLSFVGYVGIIYSQ